MKPLFGIVALILLAAVVSITVSLYPKLSNMNSEYETAQAIRDIDVYLRENEGMWPTSADDLGGIYPIGGDVTIDYDVTSAEILAQPELLRNSIRPRSGKFLTYPHYDMQIDSLVETLQETKPSEQCVPPKSDRAGG